MTRLILICVAALLAGCGDTPKSAMQGLQRGDSVEVRYVLQILPWYEPDSSFYGPAVIFGVDGSRVIVEYADGRREEFHEKWVYKEGVKP